MDGRTDAEMLRGCTQYLVYVPREAARLSHRGYLRPFLIQSDSASRKQPFLTGLFFDWIILVLLIVSRVYLIVFALFLIIHYYYHYY